MFAIEDERHSDAFGEFASREEAVAELRRLAAIPWDEPPNRAPCSSWRTCGRTFELIDLGLDGRTHASVVPLLDITSDGVKWLAERA